MSYRIHIRGDNHYLGNSNPSGDKEVHDLKNEKPQCQIDEIIKNQHAVRFSPDMLVQAHREGYDNCAYCIGGSKR
jgi:hypothetical protein